MAAEQRKNRDLVLVGDEMVPDDENYFGPGDLAMLSMEIDRQVSTAKKYPRNEAAAEAKAKKMVTETEDIALSCIYTLPRARKLIPGASVRLAEIVAYCWGNARWGSKIIEEEDEFIVAQGVYFDLERNIANTKTVRRRILDSEGRRFNIDMIQTTGSAAMAIALRNSILQGGIPSPIWVPVYDSAAALIGGATKPLSVRRTMALERFAKMGVPAEKVLARIGVRAKEDIEQEHIVILRGLAQAIKDEVVTIDQAFAEGRQGRVRQEPKRTDVGEKLRGKGNAEESPPAANEAEQGREEEAEPQAEEQAAAASTEPAQGEDETKVAAEPEASEEAAQPAAKAKAPDLLALTVDERDVIDDLRAAITAGGSRKKIADEFREAIEAMSPEAQEVANGILDGDGKKASPAEALRRL